MGKVTFDFSPRTKPLPHQIDAISYVATHQNVPLFDEQGLGKSKIIIDALCRNLRDREIDGAIIVCKKTLLYMWRNEIKKHSNLLAIVLDGAKRQRGRSLITFGQFYIVNYETLIREIELIGLLLKHRRFALVLDESQRIKNPESEAAKALLSLRESSSKRVIITGTPIANRPEDLWAQFYFLDGGATLGKDFASFKKRFEVSLKGVQDMKPFEDELRELRKRIGEVAIRRTKEVLELPEKVYENVPVEMATKQKRMYETARKEMYVEIRNSLGEPVEQQIENYLVKLLRLTQIASNPALLDPTYDEIPCKFRVLDQLIKNMVGDREKVIVWTSFTGNVRSLRKRYEEYGSQMLFGEIPIVERNRTVDRFMKEENCRVLIANPAAAKEGLTLTSANNAIYLDRNFKMDDYLQSQDRIHRIGQERKCRIVKLQAIGTVDEYTDEILEKKELIAKYAMGDSDHIEGRRDYLSIDDLLRIIGG
jgi:SNF2 family DNA or RNA helicase